MRYICHVMLLLSWGLWIGATLATFVFGLHLFHTQPSVAPVANSAMFEIFAVYEAPLLGVAILASAVRVWIDGSRPAMALFLVLIVAGGLAVFAGFWLTPAMRALRLQNPKIGPAFMRLHAESVITMSVQALLLLAAGFLLPLLRGDPSMRK